MNIRRRLEDALDGKIVEYPVYAVYDWFVKNRHDVDWNFLFESGLGQVNHASLIRHIHPHFELQETTTMQDGHARRDVRLITDKGELHEWYLGEWRQEHFIKTPDDYRIMLRALESVEVIADSKPFLESEATLGEKGITLGQLQGVDRGRTPLMALQIDWVGLEQFSIDLASEQPELLELIEVMNTIKLEEVRQAVKTPATHIKLWENLSIETLGPVYYRRYIVPLYRQILEIMNKAGKRLHVHYDGRLKAIAEDIAALDIYGIDSFTEAPEGDMSVGEARKIWPEKFLWLHPNLNWYHLQPKELKENVNRIVRQAGTKRFCLMISEEVPANWRETILFVLNAISS